MPALQEQVSQVEGSNKKRGESCESRKRVYRKNKS
jgi:hypothetical protein